MQFRRSVLPLVTSLALASCGGSNGTIPSSSVSSMRASVAQPSSAAAGHAALELAVKIPRRSRTPKYVSPSTQSLTVTEGSTKLRTVNTTPTSTGCQSIQGSTICRFTLGVIPGQNEVFTVDTFDEENGAGKLLATGKTTKNIGFGRNVIQVTMGGVVASIEVTIFDPNPPAGTATQTRVFITSKDADGNLIIAPGNYSTKIALSNSDTTGITQLSKTSIVSPNNMVTLSYSGASITSATIGASVPGIAPSMKVTTATFAPEPTVVASNELPLGHHGRPLQPVAITNGPDGNIWFSVCCDPFGIVKMTSDGTMTFYRADIPHSKLPNEFISGLAPGSDGNVWYAAKQNVGQITPSGAVTNYKLSSRLCLGATALRLVPAADGGLWVSIACVLRPYLRLAHVTTSGTIVISALNRDVATKYGGLTLAKNGDVYLAGTDTKSHRGAVEEAVVSGDKVVSTSVVTVPGTSGLLGIAQSSDGDLWATTGGCKPSQLARLHPTSSFAASDVATFPTLAGCSSPAFLTAAGETLWVAEHAYPVVTRVTPSVYPAAPALFDLPVPTPHSVPGQMWDVTLGPQGDLYYTNLSFGRAGHSSNVVRVAY